MKTALLSITAALLFTVMHIINKKISIEMGDWFWTASLRYCWIIGILLLYILFQKRNTLFDLLKIFKRYWVFWVITGTVGHGLFYAPIVFAVNHAPAWIVTSTWQLTIMCSLLVIHFIFKQKIGVSRWITAGVVLAGVFLVLFQHFNQTDIKTALLGTLPVLISVFAYPLGSQMLLKASQGGYGLIPSIESQYMKPHISNIFYHIFLLSLGTVPFWLLLGFLVQPGASSPSQIIQTGIVALLTGVGATAAFYFARATARNTQVLATVDMSQSLVVAFTVIVETLFLGALFPDTFSIVGILLIICSLLGSLVFLKQK